jgi:hypothetical protein
VTSPDGSKGSSPLRVGGLALLGVGLVAGILGVVGLNSGGGTPPPVAAPSLSTGAAPSASAELAPAPPAAPPAAPPVESAPPAAAPAPAPPPAAPPAPTTAAGSGAASSGTGAGSTVGSGAGSAEAQRSSVRVYNNSTISGLAAGAAEDFRGAGWKVDEVANYSSSDGVIPTSTVYFRPGTGEQGAAERIGSEFGLRAAPRFAGLTDASPGLIVIVTNDYQKR